MNTNQNQIKTVILSEYTLDEFKNEVINTIIYKMNEYSIYNNKNNNEEFLTRKEVSKLLGVSLPTILDWTKKGTITGYKISTRVRYKKSEINKFLNKI